MCIQGKDIEFQGFGVPATLLLGLSSYSSSSACAKSLLSWGGRGSVPGQGAPHALTMSDSSTTSCPSSLLPPQTSVLATRPSIRRPNPSIRGAEGCMNCHIMTGCQAELPTYTNRCSPGSQPLRSIALPSCRSQLWLPHLDFLTWLPVVSTTCYS